MGKVLPFFWDPNSFSQFYEDTILTWHYQDGQTLLQFIDRETQQKNYCYRKVFSVVDPEKLGCMFCTSVGFGAGGGGAGAGGGTIVRWRRAFGAA